MSRRGRRYNEEPKLNKKKVFGVIAIIAIIILFIIGINQILKSDKNKIVAKNIELSYFSLYKNGNWGVINSSGETIIEPSNGEMIEIPNKLKPVFICTFDVNNTDNTYKTKAINEKNETIFTDYENIFTIQNYDENHNLWYESNVLKVQKNGKYGLINLDGKEILPCEYDNITSMKGVKNSLIIKSDNKIGVVNTEGKIVVPVEYTEIETLEKNYENGYLVKNVDSKYGVIKPDGTIALECKFEGIDNLVDNNKYIVKENNSWKVMAQDGTIYLDGKVNDVIGMDNGNVIIKQNGKFGIINIETDLKIPYEYEDLSYLFDNKYIAKKDGKYGIINTNNEVVVDYKYQNILISKSGQYIKAQTTGANDINTPNIYDYMNKDFVTKFTAGDEIIENDFIIIRNGSDVKYYNNELEEKSNKDIYTANTLFVIKENGKFGFVNKEGKIIVEPKYDDAREQNDCGYVAVKKDGKWGSIDQYGNVVIEPEYQLKNENNIDFIGRWHVCADKNANYYSDVNEAE